MCFSLGFLTFAIDICRNEWLDAANRLWRMGQISYLLPIHVTHSFRTISEILGQIMRDGHSNQVDLWTGLSESRINQSRKSKLQLNDSEHFGQKSWKSSNVLILSKLNWLQSASTFSWNYWPERCMALLESRIFRPVRNEKCPSSVEIPFGWYCMRGSFIHIHAHAL